MITAGPKRRPVSGGYTRGDEKRDQIIAAALRIFGEIGYEKASTRRIAQEAGVNPPALQYYFESKEGLLRACMDHIGDHHTQLMAPAYAAAENIPEDASREESCAALCGILTALADHMFGSSQIEQWQRFIARVQADNAPVPHADLKQRLSSRLHGAAMRLVGIALGRPADDPAIKITTLMILGQVSVFHMQRQSTLNTLGWTDFRDERLDQLKQVLIANVRTLLYLPPAPVSN